MLFSSVSIIVVDSITSLEMVDKISDLWRHVVCAYAKKGLNFDVLHMCTYIIV